VGKTDLKYLISMTGNDMNLINELIDIFIGQVKEISNEMDEAYSKNNFELMGKLAHKAKSSVAIMGMNHLSRKLKEFENHINKGRKKNEYAVYIRLFKDECLEAIEELNIYRSSIST
jgi:HPt (histidine-containing phosphotransfer) domain-containing protein